MLDETSIAPVIDIHASEYSNSARSPGHEELTFLETLRVKSCEFLWYVPLDFKIGMDNPPSNFTRSKLQCRYIEKCYIWIVSVLQTSMKATLSQRTAMDPSDGKVSHSSTQNPTSVAPSGRYGPQLSSCKIWGEVCYFFYEKIHG
jgi:hypothetical protein